MLFASGLILSGLILEVALAAPIANNIITPFNAANFSSVSGIYTLHCTGKVWNRDHFCQGIAQSLPINSNNYEVSLQIKDYDRAAAFGHPAIIFNWKDSLNYDVVYARPHSNEVVYGFVAGGTVNLTEGGATPVTYRRELWYTFKVVVISNKSGGPTVYFYMNDVLWGSFTARYQAAGYVGFGAANGYDNIVQMQDLHVSFQDIN